MTANKPSDAIPEVMKRRIKELERDGYNKDFLRCFRNAIRSLDETDRYAHANKVQAEEIKALAARLAKAERLLNSGMIRLIQRDEFGQVGFCLFKGIDLRACIAEAIESERPVETQPGSPHFDGAATYDRATDSASVVQYKPCEICTTQSWCETHGCQCYPVSAVQPERCCLDYPRCDCNSPPEPDDDWLCFRSPAQPKVTHER